VTTQARQAVWLGLGVALLLAVAALLYLLRPAPPPRLTLVPAAIDQLAGWREDDVAAALPALRRSCDKLLRRPGAAPLGPRGDHADFGRIADWRAPCRAAAAVPSGDDRAARRFFADDFAPFLAGNNGDNEGLFTGYFEMTLHGARRREGRYQTPLYRRPPGPERTAYSRAQIDDGALAGKGLALFWVDSPIAAFFLDIQGSGLVALRDGSSVRLGYDGSNNKPYVAVGRLLIEHGELARDKVTMQSIADWMKAHPTEGAALRRQNPSYVFFRELKGPGPRGAERTVLTPGRSLAVDRRFIPLGVPIWLDAKERFASARIRRLVVAQDTGGAIRGPVRGDLFWGHGPAAASGAGAMNAKGRYYLFLPKAVAARLIAVKLAASDPAH
jgi:peptidoglycan lytic transglycosylase A